MAINETPSNEQPPEHGGDLAAAAVRYRIPVADWLDLSTGINPDPYRLPPLPDAVSQRLPGAPEALLEAARHYYQVPAETAVVAAAGSQALIQWLPLLCQQRLRERVRVAVPRIGYREHAFRWRWARHEVFEYEADAADSIDALLAREAIDVLVVINPNNPLATLVPPARLQQWLQRLQRRGGWLIVDEAFADVQPEFSMAAAAAQPGLVVLRSLGKFFGLAGLRCGFALCEQALGEALRVALGPWSLSGPAQWGAERALRDREWHIETRLQLQASSAACAQLLERVLQGIDARVLRSTLFVSVSLPVPYAAAMQQQLAQCGVWVRRIELDSARALLRFGLLHPRSAAWHRFQDSLEAAVAACADQRFSIT